MDTSVVMRLLWSGLVGHMWPGLVGQMWTGCEGYTRH